MSHPGHQPPKSTLCSPQSRRPQRKLNHIFKCSPLLNQANMQHLRGCRQTSTADTGHIRNIAPSWSITISRQLYSIYMHIHTQFWFQISCRIYQQTCQTWIYKLRNLSDMHGYWHRVETLSLKSWISACCTTILRRVPIWSWRSLLILHRIIVLRKSFDVL